MEVLLCERVNDLRHSLFNLLSCLISRRHREQGLDYREGEELSWCPSWSNSLWRGWSCGLVYCHRGNVTDPIWRVLASSDGISSRTPLKPQHSNPSPNSLANQLWCIDFLTPPTPLIIPRGCPRGVMVKGMNCGIVVREFVLQSRHYVHFRANTLGKVWTPLFSLQLWVNSRTD